MGIYTGAAGDEITLATGQDLTEATKVEYHVVKPDGSSVTWAATRSNTAGSLTYTTGPEDLDQAGAYLIMAYVEWGEVSKHPGDPYILIVRTPGYDTATYLSTPATRPIDAVRMELGKEASLALLTDSEITYNLGRANSNALLAAAFCAESIAGLYAGFVDKSMGGSSVSLSQKAEAWRKKAEALRTLAQNTSLTPRFTSSRPGRQNFWMGQHDNHGYYPPGMI